MIHSTKVIINGNIFKASVEVFYRRLFEPFFFFFTFPAITCHLQPFPVSLLAKSRKHFHFSLPVNAVEGVAVEVWKKSSLGSFRRWTFGLSFITTEISF